jgi:SAM-dependent methyltransferase
MASGSSHRTYSSFGLRRSLHQLRHAAARRRGAAARASVLLERFQRDQGRITDALGRALRGLRVLEIGPGQRPLRAGVLALENDVTGVDLDTLPRGLDPLGHLRLLVENGPGRLAKTVGRRVLGVDRAERQAWAQLLGVPRLGQPSFLQADIQREPPGVAAYDLAVSWSVFEHLPDPEAALNNVIAALRPGGVLYLGIHLYTSNNGHHDIRAFTGQTESLPLWGHLRTSQQHLIEPSSYLNAWRLKQWRELFARLCPDHSEYDERYGEERLGGLLQDADLRRELSAYDDDELLTVEVYFRWKKPS